MLLCSSLSLLLCIFHNVDKLSPSEGGCTPKRDGLAFKAAAGEVAVGVEGGLFTTCNLAFRTSGVAILLLGLGDLNMGDGDRAPTAGASLAPSRPVAVAMALSSPRRGEVRLDRMLLIGSTEIVGAVSPSRFWLLTGGTLPAKAAGAETEDKLDRAWSDPYPDSDLKLSDLVSDRVPAIHVLRFENVRSLRNENTVNEKSWVSKTRCKLGAPRTTMAFGEHTYNLTHRPFEKGACTLSTNSSGGKKSKKKCKRIAGISCLCNSRGRRRRRRGCMAFAISSMSALHTQHDVWSPSHLLIHLYKTTFAKQFATIRKMFVMTHVHHDVGRLYERMYRRDF